MKSDILDMVDKMVLAGQLHTEVTEALGHLADEHTDHILKEKLDRQAAEHAQRCDQFNQRANQTEERFKDFIRMIYGVDMDTAGRALNQIKRGMFPGQVLRDGQTVQRGEFGGVIEDNQKSKLKVTLPDGSTRESVPDKPWDPDGSRPDHRSSQCGKEVSASSDKCPQEGVQRAPGEEGPSSGGVQPG